MTGPPDDAAGPLLADLQEGSPTPCEVRRLFNSHDPLAWCGNPAVGNFPRIGLALFSRGTPLTGSDVLTYGVLNIVFLNFGDPGNKLTACSAIKLIDPITGRQKRLLYDVRGIDSGGHIVIKFSLRCNSEPVTMSFQNLPERSVIAATRALDQLGQFRILIVCVHRTSSLTEQAYANCGVGGESDKILPTFQRL